LRKIIGGIAVLLFPGKHAQCFACFFGRPLVPWSSPANLRFAASGPFRSVGRECLDHFIIFTQTQLRRVVGSYIDYYNNYRPRQGLHGIPNAPPEQPETGEMNLLALKGEVSRKRCLFDEVRSVRKLFNCGVYYYIFVGVAKSNRPEAPPHKRVLGY
jgi:hypothetical protein